jgi:hypothetical protein
MINRYTKAVIATLAAFVATIQAQPPVNASAWIQAAASGLGVGLVTWYVPNTTNGVTELPAPITPQNRVPGG